MPNNNFQFSLTSVAVSVATTLSACYLYFNANANGNGIIGAASSGSSTGAAAMFTTPLVFLQHFLMNARDSSSSPSSFGSGSDDLFYGQEGRRMSEIWENQVYRLSNDSMHYEWIRKGVAASRAQSAADDAPSVEEDITWILYVDVPWREDYLLSSSVNNHSSKSDDVIKSHVNSHWFQMLQKKASSSEGEAETTVINNSSLLFSSLLLEQLITNRAAGGHSNGDEDSAKQQYLEKLSKLYVGFVDASEAIGIASALEIDRYPSVRLIKPQGRMIQYNRDIFKPNELAGFLEKFYFKSNGPVKNNNPSNSNNSKTLLLNSLFTLESILPVTWSLTHYYQIALYNYLAKRSTALEGLVLGWAMRNRIVLGQCFASLVIILLFSGIFYRFFYSPSKSSKNKNGSLSSSSASSSSNRRNRLVKEN